MGSSNASIDIPDEAFLIEAPSFIVPYVFEQNGEKAIKDTLKELVEKVKAEREAKLARGEELSDEDKISELKKPVSEEYFDSPVGKLLTNIGMNLVQEFVQCDLLKMQKRQGEREKVKCRTGMMTHLTQNSILSLKKNIEESKENNEPFKAKMKKCELCNFKTESELVMSTHKETPHMKNYSYRCNFCTFTTRIPHEVMFHMEAEHAVRARLERAPAYHQCPNCQFEDNSKAKLTRHLLGCLKRFNPAKNLDPPQEWDTPAKLPKLPKNRMMPQGGINSSFLKQSQHHQGLPPGMRGNFPPLLHAAPKNKPVPGLIRASNPRGPIIPPMQRGMIINAQMLQQVVSGPTRGSGRPPYQPSISITPLPRQSSGMGQGQGPGSAGAVLSKLGQTKGGKTSFVICEICDGYIKDLDQLRNHMQWIHKVKIHPKMIYNKPPLNCQKCQFRFFTDQGLERHLLGSHGLVTSSMQDAANKGQDSGRCPLCGKVYQWKLLAHVAKDHNVTLKPAHLSYKCTVCTATFGMYKLFESHVYSAHSVAKVAPRPDRRPGLPPQQVAPRPDRRPGLPPQQHQQNKTGMQVTPRSMPTSTNQNYGYRPLKINDEITIIPQPSSNSSQRSKGSLTITPQPMLGRPGMMRGGPVDDDGIQIIEIDEVTTPVDDDDDDAEDGIQLIEIGEATANTMRNGGGRPNGETRNQFPMSETLRKRNLEITVCDSEEDARGPIKRIRQN